MLDIEDAVDPAHKDEARAGVIEWLSSGDRSAWVRINDRSTEFWDDDVAKLAGAPGLLGVMLAKTEAGEQVTETADRLGGVTPRLGRGRDGLGDEGGGPLAPGPGALHRVTTGVV